MSECYNEEGKRKGFVFYRNFRDFFFDTLEDLKKEFNIEYPDQLQNLLTVFKALLDYGLEDITEEEFLNIAYTYSRYRDILKSNMEGIKKAHERAAKGKNNYPLTFIPNGEEVKNYLESKFPGFMKPKQIKTIAIKLSAENETISFLDYCYKDLVNRNTYNEKEIAKMFASCKIFEDDFLIKYRQINKTLETLSAASQNEENNNYMFDNTEAENITF